MACSVESVQKLAEEALRYTDEFMCQSWGKDAESLFSNGMALANSEKVVVKVPATVEGIKAAKKLMEEGKRVCLTACYSAKQALIATGLGVEYVAPYLGRMNDNRKDVALLSDASLRLRSRLLHAFSCFFHCFWALTPSS